MLETMISTEFISNVNTNRFLLFFEISFYCGHIFMSVSAGVCVPAPPIYEVVLYNACSKNEL